MELETRHATFFPKLPDYSQNTLFTNKLMEHIMNVTFAINQGENVMAYPRSLSPIIDIFFLALSGGP